jgi:predicted Fe-S protein YdhL (DUF1289 family)
MDPATGLCEGCLRTLDEIATWSLLDDEEREAVWQALDERRDSIGPRHGAARRAAPPDRKS